MSKTIEEKLREDFFKAYEKMPTNFESVHPSSILNWFLPRISLLETSTYETAVRDCIKAIKNKKQYNGDKGADYLSSILIEAESSLLALIKKQ